MGNTSPYTFSNVTAAHTLTAKYGINTYTLTVSAGANGLIIPGTTTVNYGTSQTFSIAPNQGYMVEDVFIDGETSVGAVSEYTFTNVISNHSIYASFTLLQFTITSTAGENGNISPQGDVTVNYNGSQTFTITPNTNYAIDSIIVDGSYVGKPTSYPFTNVLDDHTIRAVFIQNIGAEVATLYATQIGGTRATINGSINPAGYSTAISFEYGTTIAYGNMIAASSSPVGGNNTVFVSAQLTGLTTSTTYHYRIVAVNELGSMYGVDSMFTTTATSNNPPTASAASDSIEKNRAKTLTLTGVDPDANDTTLTFFLDSQPLHGDFRGDVTNVNGTTAHIIYRPDYSFTGTDSFSYYVRDAQGARSSSTTFTLIVYAKVDTTKFRTFSQEDLLALPVKVKKVNKIPRPQGMPTAGNVLDTIFGTGTYGKLKDKTNAKYPGGMVLGVAFMEQDSKGKWIVDKDSAKIYGWIRVIGTSSKDVRVCLTQGGSAKGFDFLMGKPFIKEQKNLKAAKYSNILVGELIALKINIAASEDGITNSGFGNLIYDNPAQADTFITQRLTIQGKSLSQIAAYADTMLTYYKRYYTTTQTEEYNTMAVAIQNINKAFRSAVDTVSWSPFRLKDSIRLDQVEFLRNGSSKENIHEVISFAEMEPEKIILQQNYPNPFNPQTAIGFSLLAVGNVTLKVYDVLGQEVATLINNETMEEGMHEIQFDASRLSSGVYYYRLQAGAFTEVKKMVLMK